MGQIQGKRVFVVEDDNDIQEMVSIILSGNGYKVDMFGNLSSFKDAMQQSRPDVIVMDVMLPDGSGLETCCGIRMDGSTSNIPIIIMSAIQTQIGECADQFISKPFDIDVFKSKVEAYLSA